MIKQMVIINERKYTVACANKECDGHISVNDIYNKYVNKEVLSSSYNETCLVCGWGNVLSLSNTPSNEIDSTTEVIFNSHLTYRERRKVFILLEYYRNNELEPKDKIHIVLFTNIYKHSERDNWDLDKSYYYDNHTCPINWMGGYVIKLIEGDDDDPHGLFKWVKTITLEEALAKHPDKFNLGVTDARIDYDGTDIFLDHNLFDAYHLFEDIITFKRGIIQS